MRLAAGDTVCHRGLKFISGIVVRVMRVPDTDEEDDRSHFCKVQLKNGQFYTDRATEWALGVETPSCSPCISKPDRDEKLYAELGRMFSQF